MKKIISLTVITAILLGVTFVPANALTFKSKSNETHVFSYIPVEYTVEDPLNKASGSYIPALTAEELPTSYSSATEGKTTAARNQNPYGSCWAFSATSACESSFYKNGGELQYLSVLQLVNYFYNVKIDPLGNATGDSTNYLMSNRLNLGGNHAFTIWSLAGWTNGAPETALPYTSEYFSAVNNGTLDTKYANDYDIGHMQNGYIIPYGTDTAHLNSIKAAVMEYGSIGCSYYHDDSYMNTSTYAYFCDQSKTNHAVSIVGWNDNYQKSNFKAVSSSSSSSLIGLIASIFGASQDSSEEVLPEGNGAWLIKNSWGTNWGTDGDAHTAHSGHEGYFWLSYYDPSLIASEYVYAYDFSDDYKYNYQYDGSCGLDYVGVPDSLRLGAIYTVKGLSSTAERIDAVGIGLESANVSGTAYIYSDPDTDKPVSGKLEATVPFTTTYAGYYTIPVPNGPVINAGHDYSIVFDFNSYVYVNMDSTYQNGDWISFTADTTNDRTYQIQSSGKSTNLNASGYTARIKGYTNDAGTPINSFAVNYDANGGEDAPETQYKILDTPLTLSSEIPVRQGYEFLGWAIAKDSDTVVFHPGDIYEDDAVLYLYAVWQKKSVTSLDISVRTLTVTAGERGKAVTVMPDPGDAICNITVKNAAKTGNVYTVGSLTVTEGSHNTFLISAVGYSSDVIPVTFTDTESGAEVICNVSVKKGTKSITVTAKTVKSTKRILGIIPITEYKTTITAAAVGTSVKNVKYSLNNGRTWNTGTSFTSVYETKKFLIRVTDRENNVYDFEYVSGIVNKK